MINQEILNKINLKKNYYKMVLLNMINLHNINYI